MEKIRNEKKEKEFSEIKVVLIGGSAGLFKSKKLKALAKLSKERYFFNLLIDGEGSFKNLNGFNEDDSVFNYIIPFVEDKDDIKDLLNNLREVVNTIKSPDKIYIYVDGIVLEDKLVEILNEIKNLNGNKNIKLLFSLSHLKKFKNFKLIKILKSFYYNIEK